MDMDMDMDEITLSSIQLARLVEYLEVTVYLPEKRTYVRLKVRDDATLDS